MPSSEIIEIPNADLYKYPAQRDEKHPSDAKNQITIGDLHSNVLMLIYFLIHQNVIVMPEEDYEELVRICQFFYTINTQSYANDPKSYPSRLDKKTVKDNLASFNKIIGRVKINSDAGMVRLIGDELADRGQCDYFILKILEKLFDANVPVEILISNHGVEFIDCIEQKKDFYSVQPARQNNSVMVLDLLIRCELILRKDIEDLFNKCYKRSLRALSYTYDGNEEITIYSHAPIDLSIIKHLTEKLATKYDDSSIEKLRLTIDGINEKFSKHIVDNTIHEFFTEIEIKAASEEEYNGLHTKEDFQNFKKKYPFYLLIWNRNIQWLDRSASNNNNSEAKESVPRIKFAHGHTGVFSEHSFIYNLNHGFGQRSCALFGNILKEGNQGIGRFLYSQQTPAPIPKILASFSSPSTFPMIQKKAEAVYAALKQLSMKKGIPYLSDEAALQPQRQEALLAGLDAIKTGTFYVLTDDANILIDFLTAIDSLTKELAANPRDTVSFDKYVILISKMDGKLGHDQSRMLKGAMLAFLGSLLLVLSIGTAAISFGSTAPITGCGIALGTALIAKGAAITAVVGSAGLVGVGIYSAVTGRKSSLERTTDEFLKEVKLEKTIKK